MAAQITRRNFFIGLAVTSALSTYPARVAAQALPAWSAAPAVTNSGRIIVQSVTLNGSSTALSIGDRVILSRAATQVAAKATTRAIANRTMGLIATRVLAGATVAGPWGLAAAGLGVVAYGAYRYFTADDEVGTNVTTTHYSVLYEQSGASTIQAAIQNNCAGLPLNGGTFPNTIVLGAYNGNTAGGCAPGFRQKVIWKGVAAAAYPLPSGWSRNYAYDAGYESAADQAANLKTWWIFVSRSWPAGNGGVYEPLEVPGQTDPTYTPQSLPADVQAKPAANQMLADAVNGIWQQAVPSSDPAALPWSATNTATASEPALTITPGAATAPDLGTATVGDLISPRPSVIPSGSPIEWTFPDTVRFPDDNPDTDPGTDPGSDPGTGGTIDWGTPPANEALPDVTPMSWFPSLFTPPQLQGTCSGWTIPITTGLPVTLDPCPLMADVIPVVRPAIGVSATIAAGKILLDI